ncbi:MAG: DNA-directed RNA polymerase subunit alpha [Candidatus Magasanikiibacteriota bacterium]
MEQILLPSTIDFLETDNPNLGKVVISPCTQGYGTTLGNALRRVLLSSLPGSAVESVKINGVQHEFSAIEGVKEDVVEIILNLKQLAVKNYSDEPVMLSISKKGKGDVTAKDFVKNANVEIANPELKIATITGDITLEMEVKIGHGRGYVPVEEKDGKNIDLGTILIDSLYTPIRDVGYRVELTRVGDVTDFEKLTLNIETNGTITPRESLQQATKYLMDHFALILDAAGGENMAVAKEEVEEEALEVTEEAVAVEEEKPKKRTRKKKED